MTNARHGSTDARTPGLSVRPATPDDATALAKFVDMAGEGMPTHVWKDMAEPGETVWDVGARRAARDEGAFSWKNAVIAEKDGAVAGALVAYRIASEPAPTDDVPDMFRALVELENAALGSYYVNVLAVSPEFRKQGIARHLIGQVPRLATHQGPYSIIVANKNRAAFDLYLAEGYVEIARRDIVQGDWTCPSDQWVLLTRDR